MLCLRMDSPQLLIVAVIVVMGCAPEPTGVPEQSGFTAPPPAIVRTNAALITIDLGTLGGIYQHSAATGINDAGQVVGWSETALTVDHAFLWTQGSGMQDLGTPNGNASYATAINTIGTVAGYTQDIAGAEQPWVWESGVFTLLPLPAGFSGRATAIEFAGTVAGCMHTAGQEPLVVTWSPLSPSVYQMKAKPPIPNNFNLPPSCATGIDRQLRVTAYRDFGSVWRSGSWHLVPFGPSRLNGIDPAGTGRMVGESFRETDYWPRLDILQAVTVQPFPCALSLSSTNAGYAVNQLGMIVGGGTNCNLPSRTLPAYAFAWATEGGGQLLLPISGDSGDFGRAVALNLQDQAAGESAAFPGKLHATLWTNITPEVTVLQLPPCNPRPCRIPPKVTYIPKKFINDGILTRPGFDATLLDPSLITLGDGLGHATPVARTARGVLMASITDVDGDGLLDLKVSFSKAQLIADGVLTQTTRNFEVSAIEPTGLPWTGHYPIWVQ